MTNNLVEKDMPWFEDVWTSYQIKMFKNTFPNTDFNTMFVAIIHIIGVYAIYLGILLPPKYLWTHLLYCSIILISYIIFDKNCFMTLLANDPEIKEISPLYIRMNTAVGSIIFVMIISFIGFIYPEFSPFRIIKKIILSLE